MPPNPEPTGPSRLRKFLTGPPPISRRQFLGSLVGAAAGGVAYTRSIEPRWLAFNQRMVPGGSNSSAAGLRILHLSDFHLSEYVPLSFIERTIDLSLRQRPDLICLTGDFVTHFCADPDAYGRVLRKLSAAAPTLASLGNHDGGSWAEAYGGYADTSPIRTMLAQSGIRCLQNESSVIETKLGTIRCTGLGDLWAEELDAATAFHGIAPTEPIYHIVLSHNPDTKTDLQPFRWDLMLSGHTHGGQLWIPFFGAPLAPVRDQRYVRGLHHWQNRWLHITRGVGNLHGLRFNCRPEVSVLTLQNSST